MVRILRASVVAFALLSAPLARAHQFQCEKTVGVVQVDESGAPVLVGGLPVFVGTPGATLEVSTYPVTIGFRVRLENLDALNASTIAALDDPLADLGIAATPFGDGFAAGFTIAPGESGESVVTIQLPSYEACLQLLDPLAAAAQASCGEGVFDNRFTVLHESGMAECRARVICEPPPTGECPAGQARCAPGGPCVDVQSDEANCGACGVACDPGDTCAAGVCTAVCAPASEVCNGVDDDCDGAVDEGFGVGAACDGGDADACEEGVVVCTQAGGTTCSDATGDSAEVCGNLIDDDCDGTTDEGCGVQCTPENAATACDDGNPCTFDTCDAGACTNAFAPAGMPCGAESCGAIGACQFDEADVCDETGTALQTCLTPVCSGVGTCEATPTVRPVSCTRSTTGEVCGETPIGCPPGFFRERCCSGGTCSVNCGSCQPL